MLLGLPGAELLPHSLGNASLGTSGSNTFLCILPLLSDFWLFFRTRLPFYCLASDTLSPHSPLTTGNESVGTTSSATGISYNH